MPAWPEELNGEPGDEVAGVFALVLGMAFLINTGSIGVGVNPWVSVVTALLTLAFFGFSSARS